MLQKKFHNNSTRIFEAFVIFFLPKQGFAIVQLSSLCQGTSSPNFIGFFVQVRKKFEENPNFTVETSATLHSKKSDLGKTMSMFASLERNEN